MAPQSLQYEDERVLPPDDAVDETLAELERDEPVDRKTILVPVAVAFTAIALLTAVLVVPALTDRDGVPELETASAAAEVEAAPEPSVTSTTLSPEAEWQAWADSLSPEEHLQLQLMLSSPEEKQAWLDYVAPEPEPVASSVGYGVWDRLANCESGGNWAHQNGDSFDGGLQFHTSTWRAYGGTKYAARAYNATREQQIEIAEKVLAANGWGAWPACSRKLGLR